MAKLPTIAPVSLPKRMALNWPLGRSLSDFGRLSAAENDLISKCRNGVQCVIGDGTRPEAATAKNTIRAGLIRFLLLGGDDQHPAHENGVGLKGAWIKDSLTLNGITTALRLSLANCRIVEVLNARRARLDSLYLNGSLLAGLTADGMTVAGSVFLRAGFKSTGSVRLLRAQIGGNLDCDGGHFSCLDSDGNVIDRALNADRIVVKGAVFLRNGFSAIGEVRFIRAQIEGDLACSGGSFSNIHGVSKKVGDALNADGMYVNGVLFMRRAQFKGSIKLTGARVRSLVDDVSCWPEGSVYLNGFRYGRIGASPTDAASRIAWLNKQIPKHLGKDFRSQPWEQLIKVLREMGHPYDAAEVAMAKQNRLRKASGQIKGRVRRSLHWLYGKLAGYGHRPIWIVYWMALVWLSLAFAYDNAAHRGAFAPSNPVLHTHESGDNVDVALCGVTGDVDYLRYWIRCPGMPPEYTTFNALFYSLDLILPLVDLQQDSDWAPVVANGHGNVLWPGWWARSLMWLEILFGWMASLTLVAVLSRLVEKD